MKILIHLLILTFTLVKSCKYYLYSTNYCDDDNRNRQCNGLAIKKCTDQFELYLSKHINLSNLPQCLENFNEPNYHDMITFLKLSNLYAKKDPSYRMEPFKILVKEPGVFSDGLLATVQLQFREYLFFHIYLMYGHDIDVPQIYKAAKLCVRTSCNYKRNENIFISENETYIFSDPYSGNFIIAGNISA